MRIFTIIYFLLINAVVFGQNTTLSIMGKANYVEYSEAYSLSLKFEEDPSKCDPIIGFVSLEDQIKHFTESLIASNLATQFKEEDTFVASDFPAKRYKLIVKKLNELDDAIRLAKEQRVEVEKVYYSYPEHDYVEEDAKAILALQDAQLKAELYAGHVGKKVNRILHIDDDTFGGQFNNPFEPGSEKYERYAGVMEVLASYTPIMKTEHSTESRPGSYGLWVEFELVDK